jgi:hypothetical protein
VAVDDPGAMGRALSEVGATPGRFRSARGDLPAAFAELDVVAAGEGEGEA